MGNNVVRYVKKGIDDERVRTFFDSIDDDFYPLISQREGKLERYLAKPSEQGKIVLFEKNENLVGALAYWMEDGTATAEIIGVAKPYRGTLVLYRLLEYAVQNEAENGKIERVRADTWSTNEKQRKILETLGFKVKEMVEGDIVSDRTTVKYEVDFKEICEFFGLESSHSK